MGILGGATEILPSNRSAVCEVVVSPQGFQTPEESCTMPKSPEPRRVAQIMLSWLDLELISCEELQALWAGYGHICAIKARPIRGQVPASWHPFSKDDTGHMRKMLSYEVEQYFYDEVSPYLGDEVTVAKCLASTRHMRDKATADGLDGLTATLMSDLRLAFPVAGEKRSVLSQRQVDASLEWLSRFHSSSWKLIPTELNSLVLPPLEEMKRRQGDSPSDGGALWLNGGYTYLATRRNEYGDLAGDKASEWSDAFCHPIAGSESIAEMVARFLTPTGRPFETYIHGDVKSENLFSTGAGDKVAFYDFQYVGMGLGVCDLAKLFTCAVPLNMLTGSRRVPEELSMEDGEKKLLEYYLSTLMSHRPEGTTFEYEWDIFVRHWETALVDWCRFQASWGFWGNTNWLQARVRSILSDEGWQNWLQKQLE
ncbi:hypothetical protein PT974_07584 [Cladobotryum mycophilum]|uniref:Uncharacterized protein n=1 Tax=Cladobotryum mycophilum TaxID=491253 RepID=A0ABR0SQ18_9HYPO